MDDKLKRDPYFVAAYAQLLAQEELAGAIQDKGHTYESFAKLLAKRPEQEMHTSEVQLKKMLDTGEGLTIRKLSYFLYLLGKEVKITTTEAGKKPITANFGQRSVDC